MKPAHSGSPDGSQRGNSLQGCTPGWPVVSSARYDSLDEINDDNADARVWGGLHWRTTMERSARWSAKIAKSAVCSAFGLQCDKSRFEHDED
ncbi:MAG: hypothetical protein Q8R33_08625 [Burkholderiales bacterium]|nr:hypothetical protein [Burkholderiales bacterium]